MNPVFTKSFSVKLNEVDHRGAAKISHIFNWFQNVASLHSSTLGYPVTDLIKKNLTWVVAKYHLRIKKYPYWRENISLSTWRIKEKNNSAPREFVIKNENGKDLVQCSAIFKLLDLKSRKTVSPQKFLPDYPLMDEKVFNDDSPDIEEPGQWDFSTELTTRRSDIDINGHINNTLFMEWATENLPDDIYNSCRVSEMAVIFRKEAFYKDVLISTSKEVSTDNGKAFIHQILKKENKSVLAMLSTKWTELKK